MWKFVNPLQNLWTWIILAKIREIIQNACYFLFSTVMSKIFHIKDVCIYIVHKTKNNNNKKAEIIKIPPFKSLGTLGYLYCAWLPGWSTTVFFVMVVHESLVCSEQLNWALFFRKIFHVLQILQFSSIFCIFEPFPTVTVWFWDPSFHTEDNWGTQTQLLKKI